MENVMDNNKNQALNDLHSIQATLAVLAELASLPNSNDVPIGLSDLATVLADNAQRMKQNLTNLV
jgi:hypothetical protein